MEWIVLDYIVLEYCRTLFSTVCSGNRKKCDYWRYVVGGIEEVLWDNFKTLDLQH